MYMNCDYLGKFVLHVREYKIYISLHSCILFLVCILCLYCVDFRLAVSFDDDKFAQYITDIIREILQENPDKQPAKKVLSQNGGNNNQTDTKEIVFNNFVCCFCCYLFCVSSAKEDNETDEERDERDRNRTSELIFYLTVYVFIMSDFLIRIYPPLCILAFVFLFSRDADKYVTHIFPLKSNTNIQFH